MRPRSKRSFRLRATSLSSSRPSTDRPPLRCLNVASSTRPARPILLTNSSSHPRVSVLLDELLRLRILTREGEGPQEQLSLADPCAGRGHSRTAGTQSEPPAACSLGQRPRNAVGTPSPGESARNRRTPTSRRRREARLAAVPAGGRTNRTGRSVVRGHPSFVEQPRVSRSARWRAPIPKPQWPSGGRCTNFGGSPGWAAALGRSGRGAPSRRAGGPNRGHAEALYRCLASLGRALYRLERFRRRRSPCERRSGRCATASPARSRDAAARRPGASQGPPRSL